MENCEYYRLNIIMSINSLSASNVTANTTLKYYHNQTLRKKLKLIEGAIKLFWKKLLDHETFGSMVPWVKNCFKKNL